MSFGCWHLRGGRRKFICFGKQASRRSSVTLLEERRWEECPEYLFDTDRSGEVSYSAAQLKCKALRHLPTLEI